MADHGQAGAAKGRVRRRQHGTEIYPGSLDDGVARTTTAQGIFCEVRKVIGELKIDLLAGYILKGVFEDGAGNARIFVVQWNKRVEACDRHFERQCRVGKLDLAKRIFAL